MTIIEGIEGFPKDRYAVVTSGTFDGVHYGHRKILKKVVSAAKKNNGISAVLTFWPHPRFVLGKNGELKLLSTFEEKVSLISEVGIDFVVKIPFTLEFSKYSSSRFIKEILVDGLATNELVIGYDHRFGKNREGSFEYLKANSSVYGFKVKEIPAQDIDHISVSSSKIRQALLDGDIDVSNQYLGQPYQLTGRVVEGEKIGRSLGYPTANIKVDEEYKLVPGDGVYAVTLIIDQKLHKGMLYIGPRPTLDGINRTIEVNIFQFNRDLYGQNITVNFIRNIRGDIKFNSLEDLKQQLALDQDAALDILKDHPE